MQVVQVHLQILADRLQQRRAVQQARNRQKSVVGDARVDSRAPLLELAVGVLVDPFSQPVVDPVYVLG